MTARIVVAALAIGSLAGARNASAETHRFTATHYYITYSAAHPPALHIKPGDHVITQTIDAEGRCGGNIEI